jgi:hypothetical protein
MKLCLGVVKMKFCRIKLAETNYQEYTDVARWTWASGTEPFEQIYRDYCRHKQFCSVMPLFLSQFQDPANDIHAYYHNDQVVAWSLCRRWDEFSVESQQFAWNYKSPELELGIRSLEHECAYYKKLGYKYLYLGESANYKAQFDGYELIGPI